MRSTAERDHLSASVDETLYEWLMATAATAEDPTDLTDFYAGIMGGFARFLWDARCEGITPTQIADNVRGTVLALCRQLLDHERGGHA